MAESKHIWYKDRDGSGWLTLGLGTSKKDNIERILAISPRGEAGEHTLHALGRKSVPPGERRPPWSHQILKTGTFEAVTSYANEVADRHALAILSEKNKKWHAAPASEKQLAFLSKLAGRNPIPTGITSGQAAELINYYQAMAGLKAGGVQL